MFDNINAAGRRRQHEIPGIPGVRNQDRDMREATDRYARYSRLKFDRPHPRVLRITLASPLKMGAMDAQMHRETS